MLAFLLFLYANNIGNNKYVHVYSSGNILQCHFFWLKEETKLNGLKKKTTSNTIDLLYNVSNNIICQLCTVNQLVFELILLRDLPK